jgi:PiT family inorganic phosphate transporter
MLTLVLVVIVVALVFEFINGFHDTANSIATVVATKVLTPGQAIMLAASTNLIGAFMGTAVAKTIASGLVDTEVVTVTSQVLICALLGAIIWNLITWWRGLPSSSSHALIGGLCGAAMAASQNNWASLIWSKAGDGDWASNKGLLWKVVVPMVTSPIAGFLLGVGSSPCCTLIIASLMKAAAVVEVGAPRWVNAFFGKAQLVSAAYMGFAHGRHDAQKTMGIIALSIFGAQATGTLDNLPAWLSFLHPDGGKDDIDSWVIATCALVMAAGTAAGGWRIIKTLGHKMVKLQTDRRLRRGNRLGHDPGDCGPLRHAGVDHPQHFHRDHGRRLRQESAQAQDRGDRADRVGMDPHHPGRGRHRLRALAADRRTGLGLIRHGLVERKSRPVAGFFHAGCTGMRVRAGRHSPTSCVPSRRRCRRSPAPGGRSRPHPRSRTGGSRTIAGRARHRVRRWPGSPRGFPS